MTPNFYCNFCNIITYANPVQNLGKICQWKIVGTSYLRRIYTTFEISVEHPSTSSDAIQTNELMFRVYTDPSLCPRLLPRTSVSELVATCSDFLGNGRPSSSEVVQCACSKPPVYVVATAGYQKWPLSRVKSDPSLGCSVNTILSGSWTLTRTRILGQCKCKCTFIPGKK